MAMYGKKKMSLMSSFPFDGDERPFDGRRKRSAYSRLPREPTISEKPFLESDALDGGSLESDGGLGNGEGVNDRDGPSKEAWVDDLNKPLPQLPDPGRALGTRVVLSSRSTNLKVKPEHAGGGLASQNPTIEKIDKRLISAPLRQNPVSRHDRMLERELSHQLVQDLDNQRFPRPLTSVADAEDLELRINNLIASSNSKVAGEVRDSSDLLGGKDVGRPRRLRRGKEVFAKVRDAITDRFSPNSGKPPATRIRDCSSPGSRLGRVQGRDPDGEEELDTKALLKRRAAEGKNHENSKAQSLTGVDSPIRRKPLPIYDSMSTARDGNVFPEDPFSDDHEVGNADQKGSSPVAPSKPISFKHKRKSRLLNTLVLPTASQTRREPKFVETISPPPTGRSASLEIIPSSPVGYSTPKIRLEPSYDPNGRKKLAAFSFEKEELFDETSQDGRMSSMSLKRGREEKEVGLGVTAKKAKRRTISRDIEALAGRLGGLRASASADLTRSSRGSVVAIGLDMLSVRRSKTLRGRGGMSATATEAGYRGPTVISEDTSGEAMVEKLMTQGVINDSDVDELQMDIPEHRLGSRNL
ncbi:MAG: hypothetical protein M1839_009549 [Geoglossum umbratile]|nr:MAG: hypothetical protein M1839_009549 [Geoglossum umbratile]